MLDSWGFMLAPAIIGAGTSLYMLYQSRRKKTAEERWYEATVERTSKALSILMGFLHESVRDD